MQNSFTWIDDDVVLAIHEALIAEHGGMLGVRDPGLLASALHRARNAATYSDADAADLAAVYAHGVMKSHPFIDGNKRVAAVLVELFLNLNGYDLTASDEELLETMVRVADGRISQTKPAAWIRKNAYAVAGR